MVYEKNGSSTHSSKLSGCGPIYLKRNEPNCVCEIIFLEFNSWTVTTGVLTSPDDEDRANSGCYGSRLVFCLFISRQFPDTENFRAIFVSERR